MMKIVAQRLRESEKMLAEYIVALQYARQPELWQPFGEAGREKSVRDAGYHLIYLAEALQADTPALFIEYLAWVKTLFTSLKFPQDVLITTLECTRQALIEKLPADIYQPALNVLDAGMDSLERVVTELPGYLDPDMPLINLAQDYLAALLQGDRRSASHMILQAVDEGVSIHDIYTQVFQPSQREIGRLWQTNQISVAQEHFCTAATQLVMSQLYPYIFSSERIGRRMIVACVGEELHEIGARMVADFFEMEGWDTYFLGANTPSDSILRVVDERNPEILALSATMTFHVSKVAELIEQIRHSNLSKTRILVGGYPFNLSALLWQKVGADGYAPDARNAIAEAGKILQS